MPAADDVGARRAAWAGPTTASLWHDTVATWRQRARGRLGPWLFSRHCDHAERLTISALGHWFAVAAMEAGHADVTLHRLRHTVATTLVGQGDIPGAQYCLGHRDPSTTLQNYAHAMPLIDADAARTRDRLYAPQ
jgi:integrase